MFMKVADIKEGAQKKKRMQNKIKAMQAFQSSPNNNDKLKNIMGRKGDATDIAPSSVSEGHSDFSTGMRFHDGVMVLKV